MKNKKLKSILALLIIPGILICGLSTISNPIGFIIGGVITLTGGIFFGMVLGENLK